MYRDASRASPEPSPEPAARPLPPGLPPALLRPAALLFDMDGTLTEPLLDFAAIRKDMGIPPGLPILEALARMTPDARETANEILHAHERHAAENAKLNPGCHDILHRLRSAKIPTAIITRNSLACTRIVLVSHDLKVDALVTREDEPYKPRPEPIHLALTRLGLPYTTPAWMIGDGEHDIAAANAARVPSIWLSHAPEGNSCPFQAQPTHTITTLEGLSPLLAAFDI